VSHDGVLIAVLALAAGRGQRRGDGPVDQGRHAHDKAQDLVHQVQIGVDKVLLQVDVFIVPLLFIGKFVVRMASSHDFRSIDLFVRQRRSPMSQVVSGFWSRAMRSVFEFVV
jgi:hypothetical protein